VVGTTQHELPVERTPIGVVWLKEIGAVLAQAPKTASKHAPKIALLTTHVFANLAGQKLKTMKIKRGFWTDWRYGNFHFCLKWFFYHYL